MDSGNLYVSVNQMDLIQKYIVQKAGPKLNKFGKRMVKTKARVKSSGGFSQRAIELYAKRQTTGDSDTVLTQLAKRI